MATKTLTRWLRVGGVPHQALPLLRFFAYKIRAREKVRKGEGEPAQRYGTRAGSAIPAVRFNRMSAQTFNVVVYGEYTDSCKLPSASITRNCNYQNRATAAHPEKFND